MKKTLLAILTLVLSFTLAIPCGLTVFAAENEDYVINSPYADVNWESDKAYKGNLHTHSTISDAKEDFDNMVKGAYDQGFDFIAFTEHGVTGKQWNEKPTLRPLYWYQVITGKTQTWLTDDEYNGITTGTYPVSSTGEARGTGMFCVTGGNELNAVALSKSHVNGFFLPEGYGDHNFGYENGFEYAIKQVEEVGGVSHINHPGDWLDSRHNFSEVMDKDNINYFADLLLRYDSCLGMEVANGHNSTTRFDRVLWDNLLMACIPYGRTVTGFSNSDAHDLEDLDATFSVFMLDSEPSMENIRTAMENGTFFGVTRRVFENDLIGPKNGVDYPSLKSPTVYPMFDSLSVNGHTITANTHDASYIQWIANGKIIASQDIDKNGTAILNLDDYYENDFLYVRCEIYGETGMCFSQALVIDDGAQPLVYERDNSPAAIFNRLIDKLLSMRIYVLFEEAYKALFLDL